MAGLGSRAVTWFERMRARLLAAARQLHRNHSGGLRWAVRVVIGTTRGAALIVILVLVVGLCHVYFDRANLPDIEPFAGFEFPAIGHIYDTNGQLLIELAKEQCQETRSEARGDKTFVVDGRCPVALNRFECSICTRYHGGV